MTLQDWDEFKHKYLAKRALVKHWSEEENRDLVYGNLPKFLKDKIKYETINRREGCRWVRVTCQGANPVEDVVLELEKNWV